MPVEAEARSHRPSDPGMRAVDPLIGAHIEGRYIVERVQGRGGTSVVYAGIHEELQREVAIKVLDEASAADPEAVERFVFEARMGSSIAHGNVVGVSDFGHLPDGRPFLVMPMIAGTDMATLLAKEGPQHPRRVAALLKGVAAALGLMHVRGIVHRDIKSENLMHVEHEDGTENSLVLDFGITATRVGEASAYDDSSGTPEFMPPEALNGELFDYRGDIYSLATVAFELITGGLPFEGEDPAELRQRKSEEAPRTLSQVAKAPFPIALEAVLARGLATRPEDRHASANEFIRELEFAAEQVPDRPRFDPTPGKKGPSSYPTLVGTGASMPTRVKMKLTRGATEKSLALKAMAERAARFSSSTPPPPPLGAVALASSLPLVQSPAEVADPDAAPHWQAEEASFESGVHLMAGHEADAAPAADHGAIDGVADGAALFLRAAAEATHARDAGLDTDDLFRPRMSGSRKLIYAAATGLAALAIAIWLGGGRAPATPTATASVSPSPSIAAAPFVPTDPAPAAAAAEAPAPTPTAAPTDSPPAQLEAAAARASNVALGASATATANAGKSTAADRAALRRSTAPKEQRAKAAAATSAKRPAVREPAPASAVVSVRSKADPDRARTLTEEGTEATLRGDFAAAANHFQQAIAADAGHAPAWRGKALALERLGRTQDAAAAFRQFLKLSPTGPAADKIRARLQMLESTR